MKTWFNLVDGLREPPRAFKVAGVKSSALSIDTTSPEIHFTFGNSNYISALITLLRWLHRKNSSLAIWCHDSTAENLAKMIIEFFVAKYMSVNLTYFSNSTFSHHNFTSRKWFKLNSSKATDLNFVSNCMIKNQ